ncbi:MAG: hypothetical protein ACYTG6_17650 [Planctomycetota bacterium]|jgi:hypothetical protein
MITKEQLLASMRHETNVIKHLATKVPPDAYDYRPTPGQRSTLELMRYMTSMAVVPTAYAIRGHWNDAEAWEKEAESVTPDTFAAAMDRQMERIGTLMEEVDEGEAPTRPAKMPWGTETTLGAGLVDMVVKCFAVYRMQFFLYIKASGASEIGSANCWVGVDQPQPA